MDSAPHIFRNFPGEVTVLQCVCAGQTRDLGEAVEMLQNAALQSFLHPAASDLWNLLLH